MSVYGFRDGVFKARNLQVEQKKLQVDTLMRPISSASVLVATMDCSATAAATLSTTFGNPRAVKAVNAMSTTAERGMNLVIKGYNSQGNYEEEILVLTTGTTDSVSGNIAFAQITEIVPAVNSKGYGTFATVDIKFTDKFGLTEYCEHSDDFLQAGYFAATAGAFTSATVTSKVSATYNTVDLSGEGVTGSVVQLSYRSKFQNRESGNNV